MASPLLPYENSRLLVPEEGSVSQVNGRWVTEDTVAYLVKMFIKRAQYSGVSSGSKPIPLASQLNGEMLPGASGDQFYYRGYMLEFAPVSADYDLTATDESAITCQPVTTTPPWANTGTECQFRFGTDPIMFATKIQRSSGAYGGQGIDEILYKEMGGVEIQLTGGEVQN